MPIRQPTTQWHEPQISGNNPPPPLIYTHLSFHSPNRCHKFLSLLDLLISHPSPDPLYFSRSLISTIPSSSSTIHSPSSLSDSTICIFLSSRLSPPALITNATHLSPTRLFCQSTSLHLDPPITHWLLHRPFPLTPFYWYAPSTSSVWRKVPTQNIVHSFLPDQFPPAVRILLKIPTSASSLIY